MQEFSEQICWAFWWFWKKQHKADSNGDPILAATDLLPPAVLPRRQQPLPSHPNVALDFFGGGGAKGWGDGSGGGGGGDCDDGIGGGGGGGVGSGGGGADGNGSGGDGGSGGDI